jgi:GNAT superfamily N-acetyltransferase
MNVTIRVAESNDLPEIVRLLAADAITGKRELFSDPLLPSYYQAFEEITGDKNNDLIVAELNGSIVGTLQLTFIPNITQRGGKRALVEAVFVDEKCRGQGIGKLLMEWAIERAQQMDCRMIQLTTNKQRPDAQRFYKSLGFVNSHEGMKRKLQSDEISSKHSS